MTSINPEDEHKIMEGKGMILDKKDWQFLSLVAYRFRALATDSFLKGKIWKFHRP